MALPRLPRAVAMITTTALAVATAATAAWGSTIRPSTTVKQPNASPVTSTRATATPTGSEPGRIAYLGKGGAFVQRFLGGSPAVKLPQSAGSTWVALSPTGKVAYGSGSSAFSADPPYTTAKAVRVPPAAGALGGARFTRDGSQLALRLEKGSALLELKSGRYANTPFDDLSADAAVRVYAGRADDNYNNLFLETSAPAPARPVFTITDRAKVFAALRAQGSPAAAKIADDAEQSPPTQSTEWLTGPPALSPDGEAMYWSTNMGGGSGAAGNTQWLLMKTDVGTGRTIGLARRGTEFGRMPELEVSPDGRKLLATWSIHSSAVENPVGNDVVDLVSQKHTQLSNEAAGKSDVNIQDGQCWGANSQLVAYSGYYYDPHDPKVVGGGDPPRARFTIFVKDVATNHTIRTIDGAVRPSCG